MSKAGMFPTSTVGTPGVHGAGVIGVHGIGVRTPSAAAVAAATAGLAKLVHIAKGSTFRNGLLSMTLAIGVAPRTRLIGSTMSDEGASPIVQLSVAPVHAKRP